MRPLHAALAAALLALASAPVATVAQFSHPLTDIPPPLEGVTTAIWFPKSTGWQFTAGEAVEAVIAVRNDGPHPANVSAVMGSLNDASAFRLHYQNFSYVPATGVPELKPGTEVAVPYYFTPAASLPEHAFQVALTVFLVGGGDAAGSVYGAVTAFNRTVDIVAPVRWIDFEMLGLWATLAALLAGVGYVGYHSFGGGGGAPGGGGADGAARKPRPAGGSGGKGPRPAAAAAAAPADPAAWLKGTNFKSSK